MPDYPHVPKAATPVAASSAATRDVLVPTATNTIPDLSDTPLVPADVAFYVNGNLEDSQLITVSGQAVTVDPTFLAVYGYEIQTTDLVTAIYHA